MSVYLIGVKEFAGYRVVYTNRRSPLYVTNDKLSYSNKYREHCFAVRDLRDQIIATLTLSHNLVVKYKSTDNNFRRKGLQNELWKYAATVLGDIKHSANLTDLGRQTFKDAREASKAKRTNDEFVDYLYEEVIDILKYGVGNLAYNEVYSRIVDTLEVTDSCEYEGMLVACCEDLGIEVSNPSWNMVLTTILDKMLKELCDNLNVDYYSDTKITEDALELWQSMTF